MALSRFIKCLFLLVLVGCAESKNLSPNQSASLQSGIIGGADVTSSEEIAQTTVGIYDTKKHALCTGSLISEGLLLTAGHCVLDAKPSDLVVVFGLALLSGTKPLKRPVVNLEVNPKYKALIQELNMRPNTHFDSITDQGDIAVVSFSGGLPQGYHTARILKNPSLIANQAAVTLVGYGLSDGVAKTGAGTLREVQVQIYNAHFSKTEILFDQRDNKGACHGDSGGPAFLSSQGQLYLIGLTSRTYQDSNNDCSKFSVYTNVVAQQGFVNQAVNKLSTLN